MGNCCCCISTEKIQSKQKEIALTNGRSRCEERKSNPRPSNIFSSKKMPAGRTKKYELPNESLENREVTITNEAKIEPNNCEHLKPTSKLKEKVGASRQEAVSDTSPAESRLEAFFQKYSDKDTDCILASGTEQLCKDLNLDPTEFRVLLLAWKCDVLQMCRFTRKEFFQGCKALEVDSVKAMSSKLIKVEKTVHFKDSFRDLYRFTYGFGLDVEDGQKTLPAQVAIDLWKLVFSKNPPVFLDEWFAFLEEKKVKGISKDTWNMFLYLFETVQPDFSNYDSAEAWPSLFDEFVARKRDEEI